MIKAYSHVMYTHAQSCPHAVERNVRKASGGMGIMLGLSLVQQDYPIAVRLCLLVHGELSHLRHGPCSSSCPISLHRTKKDMSGSSQPMIKVVPLDEVHRQPRPPGYTALGLDPTERTHSPLF